MNKHGLNVDVNNTKFEAYHAPLPDDPQELVCYFAFGANMCVASLAHRGVQSQRHEKARLLKHKLVFNVVGRLNFEGHAAWGNVVDSDEHSVHGVVHWLPALHLRMLDQVEGPAYQRIPCDILTYSGETLQAMVYKQTDAYPPEYLLEERPPGRRYIRVLHHGASRVGLDPRWLELLATHRYTDFTPLALTDEQLACLRTHEFAKDDLPQLGHVFVLFGVVLKFKGEASPLARRMLHGDRTAFLLGLVSYEPSAETYAEASPEQRASVENVIQSLLQSDCHVIGRCGECPYVGDAK